MLGWRAVLQISYGQYFSDLRGTLLRWSPALVVFLAFVYLQAREFQSFDGFYWVSSLASATLFLALLYIQRRSLSVGSLAVMLPTTRFELWRGQVVAAVCATLTSASISVFGWLVLLTIYHLTAPHLPAPADLKVSASQLVGSGWFVRTWAAVAVVSFAVVVRHLIPVHSLLTHHRVQSVQRRRRERPARRTIRGAGRTAIQAANRIQNGTIKAPGAGLFGFRNLTLSWIVFALTPVIAPLLALKSTFLFFAGALVALVALLHHGLRPSALSTRASAMISAVAGGSALVTMGVIYLLALGDLRHSAADRRLAAADFLGSLSTVSDREIIQSSLTSKSLSAVQIRALYERFRIQRGRPPTLSEMDIDVVLQQASPRAIAAWGEWVKPEVWSIEQIEQFAAKVSENDFDLTSHPIRLAITQLGTPHITAWLKSDSRVLQYLALQRLSQLIAETPTIAVGMQPPVYDLAARLLAQSLDSNGAAPSNALWAKTIALASTVSGIDLQRKLEREGRLEVLRALQNAFGRKPAEVSP